SLRTENYTDGAPREYHAGGLDALKNQLSKQSGSDHELPPFRIKTGCGLCRDNFFERAALLFELCDIVPYRNKHVAVILKLRPIADRLAMTGDDDRRICRGVQVGLRRGDHPVDAASR